jgi:hypothetical protein
MPAAIVNLTIEQGADWSQPLQWKTGTPAVAVNLTGYTARMQVRRTAASTEKTVELTTENGRITITAGTGTVALSLTAAVTAAIVAGVYVYDLELVSSGGIVTRLVQGTFTVSAEVTR